MKGQEILSTQAGVESVKTVINEGYEKGLVNAFPVLEPVLLFSASVLNNELASATTL